MIITPEFASRLAAISCPLQKRIRSILGQFLSETETWHFHFYAAVRIKKHNTRTFLHCPFPLLPPPQKNSQVLPLEIHLPKTRIKLFKKTSQNRNKSVKGTQNSCMYLQDLYSIPTFFMKPFAQHHSLIPEYNQA